MFKSDTKLMPAVWILDHLLASQEDDLGVRIIPRDLCVCMHAELYHVIYVYVCMYFDSTQESGWAEVKIRKISKRQMKQSISAEIILTVV